MFRHDRFGPSCALVSGALGLVAIAGSCRSTSETGTASAEATAPASASRTTARSAPVAAPIPTAIAKVESAALLVWFGTKSGCSAVRIAENLVITAAHCAVGYDGTESRGEPNVKPGERRLPLEAVEMGPFRPPEGKMSDWLVLRAENPDEALKEHAIAEFPDRAELDRALDAVTDSLDDQHVPVWTVTFPMRSTRIHPRPSLHGSRRVACRGFLKSDAAYQESVVLGVKRGVIYDELMGVPPPRFDGDVATEWDTMRGMALHDNYARYRKPHPRLLYHSADYAPGSSGGGIFLEETGHLLGIVPFGASVVPRTKAYPGFGQLYRIDAICSESRTLADHPICGGFEK